MDKEYLSMLGISKNNNQKIGRIIDHKDSNLHTLATGLSGTGKSVFMIIQCILAYLSGRNVVIFNWKQSCMFDDMIPKIREFMEKHCVVYSAKDGVPLPLFRSMVDAEGDVESKEEMMDRVVNMLSAMSSFSVVQKNCISAAVQNILEENPDGEGIGIGLLVQKLNELDSKSGSNAASKIRPVCRAFSDKELNINCGKIVILDFNHLDTDTQAMAVSLMLEYLHRLAAKGLFKAKPLTIFIDECQSLPMGPDSTLRHILDTDRKLGVQCLLARPEIPLSSRKDDDTLNLCAYQVYFKPQDNKRRKLAKLINPAQESLWTLRLASLKTGEAVLCGPHLENGTVKNNPVIIKTPEISQIFEDYNCSKVETIPEKKTISIRPKGERNERQTSM